MLRSCDYCGRYHDDMHPCEQKKAAIERKQARIKAIRREREYPSDSYEYRRDKPEYKFRGSAAWTKRSQQVRERDHYLCLCCQAGLRGTVNRYNDDSEHGGVQVHHIIPIAEDDSLRLDETNLITVCQKHHKLCEIGIISRQKQKELVLSSIQKAQALGIQGF